MSQTAKKKTPPPCIGSRIRYEVWAYQGETDALGRNIRTLAGSYGPAAGEIEAHREAIIAQYKGLEENGCSPVLYQVCALYDELPLEDF